ncbi:MAG: hypothetical protein AB8F78_05500 [Saprospiraceae bacterium]
MRNHFLLSLFILTSIFISCGEGEIFPSRSGPNNEGWVGVYIDADSTQALRMGDTRDAINYSVRTYLRELDSSGYTSFGEYNYFLDSLRGIIVFDDTTPAWDGDSEGYFRVPGIRSIRQESGNIIVDNFADEVVLSVDDAPRLRVVERRPNRAPIFLYPEQRPQEESLAIFSDTNRGRYFECYDSDKGVLLGWVHQRDYNSVIKCFLLPE